MGMEILLYEQIQTGNFSSYIVQVAASIQVILIPVNTIQSIHSQWKITVGDAAP